MQRGDRRFRPLPQLRRELDLAPPFAFRMKDRPTRDGDAEHFLQAERLGAELGVVVLPLPAFAQLELDGRSPVHEATG